MQKILLVAYYFDPFKGVGSKRMSYWADAFFKDSSFQCTVITAIPQQKLDPRIFYVEDPGNSWGSRLFQGLSWAPKLKQFLDSNDQLTFDHAIISGGPFGHFSISRYLKKKYNCAIILDFRDPFSRNTRFKTFFLKDFIKVVFERNFLKYADALITVNTYCKELLLKHVAEDRISIIENGYDERVMQTTTTEKYDDGYHHIVYSGSFYEDRNPSVFLQTLIKYNADAPVKFMFHHIGEQSQYLLPFQGSVFVVEHGLSSYERAIQIMKKCAVGLIVTGGEAMESTTKVYDYIGCELDILIVTSGMARTGSIEAVTAKVSEKAFWSRNNEAEIMLFLRTYEPSKSTPGNMEEFSRNAGFEALKRILKRS